MIVDAIPENIPIILAIMLLLGIAICIITTLVLMTMQKKKTPNATFAELFDKVFLDDMDE